MWTNNDIMVAVVVVLIIVAVYYNWAELQKLWSTKAAFTGGGMFANGGGPPPPLMTPYAPLSVQDGAIRGARHDAFGQEHAYYSADLAKNYRDWATTPRDLEEAQRAAWFESTAARADPPTSGHGMQENMSAPSAMNYQAVLTDLVANPRMRAQHANWVSEVAPKSRTAMKVDTMDEAAAVSSYNGHGIYAFRFDAPSQHNPLFITDQDAQTYGPHATKFTFGG